MAFGVFVQDEITISSRLRIAAGARFDVLRYGVDDRIESESSRRTLSQPSIWRSAW